MHSITSNAVAEATKVVTNIVLVDDAYWKLQLERCGKIGIFKIYLKVGTVQQYNFSDIHISNDCKCALCWDASCKGEAYTGLLSDGNSYLVAAANSMASGSLSVIID